jgi:hypothetical protein
MNLTVLDFGMIWKVLAATPTSSSMLTIICFFTAPITSNECFGVRLPLLKPNPDWPLICFGQDESIFHQFIFSNKAWMGPDGTTALLPRDDGLPGPDGFIICVAIIWIWVEPIKK